MYWRNTVSQGIPRNDVPKPSRDTLLNFIRNVNWKSLLAGAAIGMIGVHLVSVRPTIDRIARLERQVADVEVGVHRVAAAGENVGAANSLLAALNAQAAEVEAARESLAAIDNLRLALQTEVDRAAEAEASLNRLTALNSQLIEADELRSEAAAAIDEVERLQAKVIALSNPTETAGRQIATTLATLDDVNALQSRLIETGENTTRSANVAEELVALQCMILSAGDLDLSEQNAERLIALQNQLIVDERLQLDQADTNLEDLIVMQKMIANQTAQIADSIDSLELLTDFQGEMNGQLAGLEDLRRQLTELILLETTVTRAMEALEPLASMQNLRRLDQEEVRDVARLILEQRRERLARAGSKYDVPAPPAVEVPEVHRLVPEPPVEE
ncbi:MAG: hypothetical protein DWQ29_00345 [Planctomycetota bacterium]|nr:MAG: hypothetical protein DWQ29_00345 [Planctomycetota bacterium]